MMDNDRFVLLTSARFHFINFTKIVRFQVEFVSDTASLIGGHVQPIFVLNTVKMI